MDILNLSKALLDCYEWDLHDDIERFDAIMESFMTTDVARDKVREELLDWQESVSEVVEEMAEVAPYEGFREFAMMAEEMFGTEV